MKIETDFGLIIERVPDEQGIDHLKISDEDGNSITLNSDQYVELRHSVKMINADWDDEV